MDYVIPVSADPRSTLLAAKLRRAAAEAGIGPDEPLRPVIDAMAEFASLMPEVAERIEVAAERANSPLTTHQVEQLAFSLSSGAERKVVDLIAATNRRTMTIAVAVGLVGIIAVAAACFFYGRYRGVAEVQQAIDAMPTAAARYSAAGAREWLTLMQNNDIDAVLSHCRPDIQNGRKVCTTAFWLEPPKPTAPNN